MMSRYCRLQVAFIATLMDADAADTPRHAMLMMLLPLLAL